MAAYRRHDCLQHVWWNSDVIIIGDAGLKKDHEVIQFLAKEGRVSSLGYFRDGVDAFEKAFPFLVGQSLKAHRDLVYPTPVVDRRVYLGNWNSAADSEKLRHLQITRLVSIHNEPKNLKFPSAHYACVSLVCRHLKGEARTRAAVIEQWCAQHPSCICTPVHGAERNLRV